MNVATIESTRFDAQQKLEQYVRLREEGRATDADRIIERGYRALARGRRLLDLVETLKRAGVDHQGRPKLAIARAHAEFCWWRCNSAWSPSFRWRDVVASMHRWNAFAGVLPRRDYIPLPKGTLPELPRNEREVRAIVPTIPPHLRPKTRLDHFFILWEADWQAVPVDPMLLRHLDGPLYVVLAAWDLTPLERAVLAGRL